VAEYFVIMQKKCNFADADRHAEAPVWGYERRDVKLNIKKAFIRAYSWQAEILAKFRLESRI